MPLRGQVRTDWEIVSMYSMVLMMAMSSGGDVAAFGHKSKSCNGCDGGCSGVVVYSCSGSTSCNGCDGGSGCCGGGRGGFFGLRGRMGKHKSKSCNGCDGGSGCCGGAPASCYGGEPAGCAGTPVPTYAPAPVVVPAPAAAPAPAPGVTPMPAKEVVPMKTT